LEEARWRLRFVVWFDLLLRATFLDCKILRPSGTVAATNWTLREIFSGRRASWIGRMLAIVATIDFGFSLPTAADTEVPKNTISDE